MLALVKAYWWSPLIQGHAEVALPPLPWPVESDLTARFAEWPCPDQAKSVGSLSEVGEPGL